MAVHTRTYGERRPLAGSALLAVLSETRLLFRALGLDEFAVKTCDIAQ